MTSIRARPRRALLVQALAVAAAACTSNKPTPPPEATGPVPLGGTIWRVVDVGGRVPPRETRGVEPYLRISPNLDQAEGQTGVNFFHATIVVRDASIRIGPPAVTRRAGPQPAMQFETAMLVAMQRTALYRITGDDLELTDATGLVLMRLGAPPMP
jgi:heat shock protein HslJ